MPEVQQKSDRIILSTQNSSAEVLLYGATVLSWKVGGVEQLFLSKKAILDGSKAVRGGIPIVFPQFGPGALPQHGFARNQTFKFISSSDGKDSTVSATFELQSNAATRAVWDYEFTLRYTVTLTGSALKTVLHVINPVHVQKTFQFTSLLHTYFDLGQQLIEQARVGGLSGCQYKDKVKNGQLLTQDQSDITFNQEVDRVYVDGGKRDSLTIHLDKSSVEPHIIIQPFNFNDVVVWNPWADKAKAMSDFDDQEYKRMVCVEVGTVDKPVKLQPGQEWLAGQVLVAQKKSN
ncbi:hypothetical protein MIR68_010888 [Amoeboaphelidium protococcarum]|nr:hypothetical protein MIR68_010888 [Amoeboaphelidium protococcarum]